MAIVPGDYFDLVTTTAPNALVPRRIAIPPAPGTHELHRNRFSLAAQHLTAAHEWPVAIAAEEIILVDAGDLTLATAGQTQKFAAGSVVILPRGFQGRAAAGAGYRALNMRWL